jgi:hypothetical protein
MGNWLSLKQAQSLLNTPDISTLKGLRPGGPTINLGGSNELTAAAMVAH